MALVIGDFRNPATVEWRSIGVGERVNILGAVALGTDSGAKEVILDCPSF
jgi:hypothetical protein